MSSPERKFRLRPQPSRVTRRWFVTRIGASAAEIAAGLVAQSTLKQSAIDYPFIAAGTTTLLSTGYVTLISKLARRVSNIEPLTAGAAAGTVSLGFPIGRALGRILTPSSHSPL